MSHAIDKTPRGFAMYADLRDSYDNRIRVQESSAASGEFCWVFVGDPGGSYGVHLDVKSACVIADALLSFIDDVAQRRPEEDDRVMKAGLR
jgi:hypothetical protein